MSSIGNSCRTTVAFRGVIFVHEHLNGLWPRIEFNNLRGRDLGPVRHGTAQYLGHGIRVVCGIEFQPLLLGILLQQAQPFQATACTLTDQLNQILQLALVRRPDPLKPGPVIAVDVYAIKKQDVKVYIQVEG